MGIPLSPACMGSAYPQPPLQLPLPLQRSVGTTETIEIPPVTQPTMPTLSSGILLPSTPPTIPPPPPEPQPQPQPILPPAESLIPPITLPQSLPLVFGVDLSAYATSTNTQPPSTEPTSENHRYQRLRYLAETGTNVESLACTIGINDDVMFRSRSIQRGRPDDPLGTSTQGARRAGEGRMVARHGGAGESVVHGLSDHSFEDEDIDLGDVADGTWLRRGVQGGEWWS